MCVTMLVKACFGPAGTTKVQRASGGCRKASQCSSPMGPGVKKRADLSRRAEHSPKL